MTCRQDWTARTSSSRIIARSYLQLVSPACAPCQTDQPATCLLACIASFPPPWLPAWLQDFTQAELVMDLLITSDPNAIFLCGDTAQVRLPQSWCASVSASHFSGSVA